MKAALVVVAVLLASRARAEPGTIVFVRHGESTFNRDGRFAGRADPPLTRAGRSQARRAAGKLAGLSIDRAYTSSLRRAQDTATILLGTLGQAGVPTTSHAALDERDYGRLTGLRHEDAERRWGRARIAGWRRSFSARPPGGESVEDTQARAVALYEAEILPQLRAGKTVLVSSHKNTIRALLGHLEGLTPEAIETLSVPNGEPLIVRTAPAR